MIPTDLKGLNNFMRRLEKVKQLETVKDKVSSNVADKGTELARTAYSSTGVENVDVSKQVSTDGDYAVVAQGDGLSFEEFGTGYQGLHSGYPNDKLPDSGVPITGEWEYYYDNPKTKRTVGGRRGWFVPKDVTGEHIDEIGFTEGQVAGMQMYKTSVELGKQATDIASGIIKELLK